MTTRTTSTTSVSIPVNSEPLSPNQAPIIVLQDSPVIIQPNLRGNDHVETAEAMGTTRHPNPYHRRHRRHQYAQEIPPLFLSPENLEQIVIHHSPLLSSLLPNNGPDPVHHGKR